MGCLKCGVELREADAATYRGLCEDCWVGVPCSRWYRDGVLSNVGKFRRGPDGGRERLQYNSMSDKMPKADRP